MAFSPTMDEIAEDLTARSKRALAERRANGEIMTYVRDGWVFRERPGKRIECVGRYDDAVMAGFRALHAESLKSAAD